MFARFLGKLREASGALLTASTSLKKTSAHKALPGTNSELLLEWFPGDVILGRYRVEEKMSGAMGHVYICEHLGWGIKIAVKSPRPEVLRDSEGTKRIMREANSWARLDMHPHIATCYYVLSIEKIPHLFIEYVDGGDLSAWIKSGRCKDVRTSLSLAIQFCHGMEFTHDQGIIHRDIKPQNVLVSKDAVVKITDFGIHLPVSKADCELEVISLAADSEEEATVGFRGSPAYASPEQLQCTHEVDERTDIFSFGLCLWLMFCGQKPFKNNTLRHEIPEPVPLQGGTFPDILADALKRCVQYEPKDRFRNFSELRLALNQAYESIFNASCPYAELGQVDLRADSLNNRAVSLYELGKSDEARLCLEEALSIDDLLPEAIHNHILLQWHTGKLDTQDARQQLNAASMRLPGIDFFSSLLEAISLAESQADTPDKNSRRLELRLCYPKKSLAIYRDAQLNMTIKRNLLDHLKNKKYQACHAVLLPAWRNNAFRKDRIFNNTYEELLSAGGLKVAVQGAQRYLTLRGFPACSALSCYLPEARLLASTGVKSDSILLLGMQPKSTSRSLTTAANSVTVLAAAPVGKILCAGSETGSLLFYDLAKSAQPVVKAAHSGPVSCMAFHPSGNRMVSGAHDGMFIHRSFAGGKEAARRSPITSPPEKVVFLDRGQRMASGHADGSILFWENGGAECTRISPAHNAPLLSIAGDPNGHLLVSASHEGELKVWDARDGRCLRTIPHPAESMTALHFLPDNRTVIAGFAEDIIKILDVASGKWGLVLDGRGNGIQNLAAGPMPHSFFSGHTDGSASLWIVVYELKFQ